VKAIVSFAVFAGAIVSGADVAIAQDSAAGEVAFAKCQACHTVGVGATNKIGPELNGLDGRATGSAAGYQYSAALKNAGFTWDQASFTAFMQNPRTKVPNNKMAFAGMKDPSEIANLWAYLSQFKTDGSPK
jgi:cytochrome c